MPFKMTCEPDDYEGPWPSEDAMTKPTVDSLMGLVKDYACRSFIPGSGMKEAHDKLRAALESLIAAPTAPQPDSGDLYSRLHSLSKSMEGRGHIDEDELPDAYPALLDAMAFVRGWSPPAEPQEHTGRWNIDVDDSDGSLRICKGEHEKSEACVYERYVPESKAPLSIDGKSAAPQQAEPVAWAVFDPSGEAIYAALFKTRCVEYVDNEYRYGHGAAKHWAVRPVFAHPPAAEVQRLRDSARDAVNEHCVHGGLRTSVFNPLINALRRALEGK